jgi:hypothetical protein
MPHSYRPRAGTTPATWRAYDTSQMLIAAMSMRESKLGMTRGPGIREAIADFERRKTPPAAQFVYVTNR